jgi:hemerythrin superfamily protein
MPDVFDVLKQDHTEVEVMLAQLTAGGPNGKRDAELAERLVIAESRHEAAEEMYFWPAVRAHVEGGDQLADQALAQEREGKEILDRLRKCTPEDAEFESLIRSFATAGGVHIAFEEEQVWPKLRQTLTDSERSELGDQVLSAKESGPTRPHPHSPDSPGALKSAGTVASAVDKARDAITGRGD